jgi:hypothetical protein
MRVRLGLCLLLAVVATQAIGSIALAHADRSGTRCRAELGLITQPEAPCDVSGG